MTSGIATDDLAHKWLAALSTSSYASLHYDDPTLGAINANELSGGGYVRAKINFTTPVNRTIWSIDDIRWNGLIQGQLTHWALWDALSGGSMTYTGRLPTTVSVLQGKGYMIPAGQLAVSIA